MKFLFINTPPYMPVQVHLPPLGILYLARILENNGHQVSIIDCSAEGINKREIQKQVLSSDAVGLSVFSYFLEGAHKIVEIIKEKDPNVPLLMGGPHCTLAPHQAIREFPIDICAIGEAELIIEPLVEVIGGKRRLSSIPGIYYKEKNKIKHTTSPKWVKNLDTIPFPAHHLVEKYDYRYSIRDKFLKGKRTSLITSRGCPSRCRFCEIPSMISEYRERSVDNVSKEIDELVDKGYKKICIEDQNFLGNKKRAEKILDHIIQNDYNIRMEIGGARVDSADERLYQKMRDAGVELILYGIESGNQDVLDFYNKKITLSQVRKAVKLSKKMGFITSGSFILGAHIETKKHIKNTIRFAKSLSLDIVAFNNLIYMCGSLLWKEAVEEGKIQPDEYTVPADSQRGLGNFTKEELVNYCRKALKGYYLDPRYIIKQLIKAFKRKDFRFIKTDLNMSTARKIFKF
ncbi:MAG: B12-binding domain-containing radical SAM protein [Petrotogales bacterium]